MNNLDLEILELQGAKFVEIEPGTKRPRGAGWQHRPYRLEQVSTDGIGLLLGDISDGIGALDFDGASAIDYWENKVGIELPPSVMWTSGKSGRFQIALKIPREFRENFPTKFAVNTGNREQLEWRYGSGNTGFQSVLPPSRHPELDRYQWIDGHSPRDVTVADATEAILEWIVKTDIDLHKPKSVVIPQVSGGSSDVDTMSEEAALKKIFAIISSMQPGDRSYKACQIGGIMRYVRPMIHDSILQKLKMAGCDSVALKSAIKYSQK